MERYDQQSNFLCDFLSLLILHAMFLPTSEYDRYGGGPLFPDDYHYVLNC